MWFVEKKIYAALPKMANAAKSDALRAALKKYEGETERQWFALEQSLGQSTGPPRKGHR